ncbi:MAG: hypothetical protein ACOZQL_14450 [Myxococcota bacterium]
MRTAPFVCLGLLAGLALSTCRPALWLDDGLSERNDAGLLDEASSESALPTDGGFSLRLRVLSDLGLGSRVAATALGPSGALAGYTADRGTQRVFLRAGDGGLVTWSASEDDGRPYQINSIDAVDSVCGYAHVTDSQFHAVTATAVAGSAPTGTTPLLPAPLTSNCLGGNTRGQFIGTWQAQGYIRDTDGGVVRLDLLRFPPPRTDSVYVEPSAINELGDVVGFVQTADFAGYGNPTAFVRYANGTVHLLSNGRRTGVATDINDNRTVVGYGIATDDHDASPLVWRFGSDAGPEALPLPTNAILGRALAVNDSEVVVGYVLDPQYVERGAFWVGSRLYVVDELLERTGGELRIGRLIGVNNRGRMAGEAWLTSRPADGGQAEFTILPVLIDLEFE